MKNKEEPSAHSQRGNSWVQAFLSLAEDDGSQTRSSPLRPSPGGASVAARAEQPALGTFANIRPPNRHRTPVVGRGLREFRCD